MPIYTLVPGLFAWITTVLVPVSFRGASVYARVTATVAVIALVLGPIISSRQPRLGRMVGVAVFVAFSLFTWILLGNYVDIQRVDPVRGFAGAVGWAMFAFGWGRVRRVGAVPEEDPHVISGPPMPARAALPTGAYAIFVLASVGALVPLVLAWRVSAPRPCDLGAWGRPGDRRVDDHRRLAGCG